MGKVMIKLTLTNLVDSGNADRGMISNDKVRRIELDALVDTGATMLVIPADAARALGLRELPPRRAKLADGSIRDFSVVKDLQIEILGREMTCDALVAPEGSIPLIGQIPLEALDLIVDPKSRELRVNPASPDTPLLDLLRAS
jgi:clan AA aspartic protease